jgi:mitochondrial fission protein ELM1
MRPITLLLISDGKAGHATISEGIAQSIYHHRAVKIVTLDIKLRTGIFRLLLTWLLNHLTFSSASLIRQAMHIFYKLPSLDSFSTPDLIISTGGNTSFANILLSKYWHVPNVYGSSLRGLNPTLFSRIITTESSGLSNETVLDLVPSKAAVATPNPPSNSNRWAVLIGGNSNEYAFNLSDYTTLAESLLGLAKKHQAKLLITTSRRTSPEVENILEAIAQKWPDHIEKLVLFHKKPEKVVSFFLQTASIVFCTEDSGSMITEAILSHRKVYSLRPEKNSLSERYNNFLKQNIAKSYLYSVDISNIKSITFCEFFAPLASNPFEETYNSLSSLLPPKENI